MFRIKAVIGMRPHAIPGIDMIRLIPRLRLSADGEEQLKAENNQEDNDARDFINAVAVWETGVHVCLS